MLIFQGTCNNTIVILILENHVGGLLKKNMEYLCFLILNCGKKALISLKISVNTKIRISYFIYINIIYIFQFSLLYFL